MDYGAHLGVGTSGSNMELILHEQHNSVIFAMYYKGFFFFA